MEKLLTLGIALPYGGTQAPPAGRGAHRKASTVVFPSWLASVLAAGAGYMATHDEYRWLAWLFLVPMFMVKRSGKWRWALFALILNSLFLMPYLLALGLETEDSHYSVLLYLVLVALTVLPYALVDWIEARRSWLCITATIRLFVLAASVMAIWLVSDHFLATKYWYALALDPAPLWVVRTVGEEGLALAMVCSSLMVAMALRQRRQHRLLVLVVCAGMLGYLFVGNPLVGAARNWPSLDILAIQSAADHDASDEARNNLAGMSIARHAGWKTNLVLLPELKGFPLDQKSLHLAPYLEASRYYGTSILINGSRPTSADATYERSSGIVHTGLLSGDFVAKRRLFPYYESRRGKAGARWTAGPNDGPRMLPHDRGFIVPLLCYDIFNRSAVRSSAPGAVLVTLAADTDRFRHPAVDRYLFHAAAFQSQVIRRPVLIANNAGSSGVVFPDGSRIVALRRGEAGVFRITPNGTVSTLPLKL